MNGEDESEAAGVEGDATKDDSYDALRFCDPNLGDSGSQWGGRNRKCCGITDKLSQRCLKGSSFNPVCKHEVLAFDYDHDSVSDGADFFDIDDEASEHRDMSGPPNDHVLFECRDLTLDDEASFYDSGDFSFATLFDLLEKYQAKLEKYGAKRASVINPDTEVYCPFGAFALGGVKVVTKATAENTALVRYLNAFARAHVGPEATWSSVVVAKGSIRRCATTSTTSLAPGTTAPSSDIETVVGTLGRDPEHLRPGSQRPESGLEECRTERMATRLRPFHCEETFVKFDPAVKRAVLPGHGDMGGAWCAIPRAAPGQVPQELWLPHAGAQHQKEGDGQSQTLQGCPQLDRQHGREVERAASSFLNERLRPAPSTTRSSCSRSAALMAPWKQPTLAVMEPMSWEEYSDPDYVEQAYHTGAGRHS